MSSLPDVVSEGGRDFCRRIKKCTVQTSANLLAHLAAQTKAGHKDTATFRLWRKAGRSVRRNGGVTQCLRHGAFRSDLPVLACQTGCAGIC